MQKKKKESKGHLAQIVRRKIQLRLNPLVKFIKGQKKLKMIRLFFNFYFKYQYFSFLTK